MKTGTKITVFSALIMPALVMADQGPRGIVLRNSLIGVEVGYFELDDDVDDPITDIDSSAIAYAIGGRVPATERIDFSASLAFTSADFETTGGMSGDVDVRSFSFGPTVIIDDSTDWIPAVSADFISSRSEVSIGGESDTDTDTGFSFSGGAERILSPDSSLLLELSYTDIDESNFSGLIGGAHNLDADFLLTTFFHYDFDDSLIGLSVGLDYRFGN